MNVSFSEQLNLNIYRTKVFETPNFNTIKK
jgi:hypothetical protein